jgi:hypothetical protein
VPDRYPAIEDHAVIGDLHTVALAATDGTIDWCCLPRFDSPAVFASLLDADRGGSFAVRSEAVRTRQLHKPGTNVLVTRFLGTDSVGEAAGFTVPRHPGTPLMRPGPLLVRQLQAVRGTVVFTITCRPAFDFGRQDHAGPPWRGVRQPRSPGRTGPARQPPVLRGRARRHGNGHPGPRGRPGPAAGVGRPAPAETRGEGPQASRPSRTPPAPGNSTGSTAPATTTSTTKSNTSGRPSPSSQTSSRATLPLSTPRPPRLRPPEKT